MNARLLTLTLALYCAFSSAQDCSTIGFETFSVGSQASAQGWTVSQAMFYPGGQNGFCAALSPTTAGGFSVAGNFSPASPFTGTNVANLNTTAGYKRMEMAVNVTTANPVIRLAYNITFAGLGHAGCCSNSYFMMYFRDSTGTVPLNTCSVSATHGGTSCANSATLGMTSGTAGVSTNGWLVKTVDLSAFIGQKVILTVEAGACTSGGHPVSLYFDIECLPDLFAQSYLPQNGVYLACDQPTVTLTAPSSDTYEWKGPVPTQTTQVLTTTVAGLYTLTLGNNGCQVLKSFSLVTGTTPSLTISAPSSICKNAVLTLSASGQGINTYSWNTGATTSVVTLTASSTAVYQVTVNAASCAAAKSATVVVNPCTAINDLASAQTAWELFPNPSGGSITVTSASGTSVSLFDLTGRKVAILTPDASNNYRASLFSLKPGVYFATGGSRCVKVVVSD